MPQKKRTHKVSFGERVGARRVRLTERERPASLRGGLVAKFKPIGDVKYSSSRDD